MSGKQAEQLENFSCIRLAYLLACVGSIVERKRRERSTHNIPLACLSRARMVGTESMMHLIIRSSNHFVNLSRCSWTREGVSRLKHNEGCT